MSDHRYKKVEKPALPRVRFSDAVRQWGDSWRVALPDSWRHIEYTFDRREAAAMELMETGVLPRA